MLLRGESARWLYGVPAPVVQRRPGAIHWYLRRPLTSTAANQQPIRRVLDLDPGKPPGPHRAQDMDKFKGRVVINVAFRPGLSPIKTATQSARSLWAMASPIATRP